MSTNVAFCRDLERGMTGADVVAHKRAISRFDPAVYPWPSGDGFTPFFGEYFEAAVMKFQKRRGIRADEPGTIGAKTHEMLEAELNAKGDPVFDSLAAKLAGDFCAGYKERTVRDRIVKNALFYYSHRASIAYSQSRPFDTTPPPHVPRRLDCSALATICHIHADAPNPNGDVPDGLGYTGTLMSRGRRVTAVTELEPGDLIFYGSSSGRPGFNRGDPTHVAVYVGVFDGVHMVVSNGSYPMRFSPYNYRRDINHYRAYDVTR